MLTYAELHQFICQCGQSADASERPQWGVLASAISRMSDGDAYMLLPHVTGADVEREAAAADLRGLAGRLAEHVAQEVPTLNHNASWWWERSRLAADARAAGLLPDATREG